jgi:hypothetical protein
VPEDGILEGQERLKGPKSEKAAALLEGLVYGGGFLKVNIKDGMAALRPHAGDLEAVHIRLDYPAPSIWRKKGYYHIRRYEVCSRLDEWIFDNLVDQGEYAAYLEKYRPAKARGEIGDIDGHIMDIHYRPRAIRMLRGKKSFDLAGWTKKRTRLEYERRSNLFWKNGAEHGFDYRNPVESFYIRKTGGRREVIGVGGAGSSGQRENNTFFTAVFFLLGKKTRISHYLLNYNGFNGFEFIGRKYRAVLTPGFGSNFNLDQQLEKEIREKGIYWK